MKSRIRLSLFSSVQTAALLVALYAGCMCSVHEKPLFYNLLAILVILVVVGCLFGVVAIKADDRHITMVSIFRSKRIAMADVSGVELFQPTMGAVRLFASGGFMGYWGMFREGDIGRYYGFYGKASDCFLVRMANGDKYVLGCENPKAMVDYIRARMRK